VSKRVTGLETAREEDQQHSRSGNLKITYIPEDYKDVYSATQKIFQVRGVELERDHIDVAHRVQSFNKGQPCLIIVRLVSRWRKEALLDKLYKNREKLTTGRIGLNDANTPV